MTIPDEKIINRIPEIYKKKIIKNNFFLDIKIWLEIRKHVGLKFFTQFVWKSFQYSYLIFKQFFFTVYGSNFRYSSRMYLLTLVILFFFRPAVDSTNSYFAAEKTQYWCCRRSLTPLWTHRSGQIGSFDYSTMSLRESRFTFSSGVEVDRRKMRIILTSCTRITCHASRAFDEIPLMSMQRAEST